MTLYQDTPHLIFDSFSKVAAPVNFIVARNRDDVNCNLGEIGRMLLKIAVRASAFRTGCGAEQMGSETVLTELLQPIESKRTHCFVTKSINGQNDMSVDCPRRTEQRACRIRHMAPEVKAAHPESSRDQAEWVPDGGSLQLKLQDHKLKSRAPLFTARDPIPDRFMLMRRPSRTSNSLASHNLLRSGE